MQCPKCSYEPTMSEMQLSSDQCPSCGVYYAKVNNPLASSAEAATALKAENKVRFSDWLDSNPYARVVGALVIGLVVGYFAGREHVKYEIKSAFLGTAASLGAAFNSANPFAAAKDAEVKPQVETEKSYPITVSFLSKDFYKADFQSFMTISLQFLNGTGKPVRAFDGEVVFTDLLGNEILTSTVSISDPVGPGAALKWDGEIKYNEYISRHQRFKNSEIQNMKATFKLQKVLYQDGKLEDF